MKISIVIPLLRNTHSTNDEVERFCQIGLPSLLKHLHLPDIDRLVVITPENGALEVEARIRQVLQGAMRLRIVHDHHLSPLPLTGWLFQQLLKLEAARFVTTPYYLILDSDIYLTKPFVPSKDLFHPDGRLRMTTDPLRYHPEWYGPSARLLKTTMEGLYPSLDTRVMQVTPQVLVKDEVVGLLTWLSIEYGATTYQEHMLRSGFTEFSLYWSWLQKNNKTAELYDITCGGNIGKESPQSKIDKELDTPRLMGNALWFYPEAPYTLATWIDRQFNQNQNYWFSLVQSNIQGIHLTEIVALLRPRFA